VKHLAYELTMKETAREKLRAIVSDETSDWLEEAKWRKENRDWLNKSAKIAIKILREIRLQKESKGMSQKVLAEILNVSPQYINKIVKGQENLSLETISKLEKALGIVLIEVSVIQKTQEIPTDFYNPTFGINRNNTQKVAAQTIDLKTEFVSQKTGKEEIAA